MEEIEITSWHEMIQVLESKVNYIDNITKHIQFRGQSNKNWKLLSSLGRIALGNEISEKKVKYYESQSQRIFLEQVHLLDSTINYNPDTHFLAVCIDMQHYSCPTRLLDWSDSPYVALYFAINENFENDSALYIWNYQQYLGNFKKMHHADVEDFDILNFKNFDYLQLLFSTRKNERAVRQQGTFCASNNILVPHDDIIISLSQQTQSDCGLCKVNIPKRLKMEFLGRLHQMNITSSSLFPGLDGLGKTIKENLLLRKWSKR